MATRRKKTIRFRVLEEIVCKAIPTVSTSQKAARGEAGRIVVLKEQVTGLAGPNSKHGGNSRPRSAKRRRRS